MDLTIDLTRLTSVLTLSSRAVQERLQYTILRVLNTVASDASPLYIYSKC